MNKKTIYIWIVLIYLAIGIFFSYPLILNFNNGLPYSYHPAEGFQEVNLTEGDYLQLFYKLWLFKDYFFSPEQHFFKEPYEFTAPWMPRPYEPRELPLSMLFLLLTTFGNIQAYNCLIIFSFLACGLSMFTLCKHYTKNNFSSLIGGIIFTIFPFRLAQLFGGHPNGLVIFWLPLLVYAYEKLWQTGKWRYGFLAGISIFSMGIEELHLGYFSALFTIIFWLYKYFSSPPLRRRNVFKLSIPIAISWLITGGYLFSLKFLVLSPASVASGRGFDEIKLYAPTIGNLFSRITLDSEKYIYLGIPTTVLALIFVIYVFRKIAKSPINKIRDYFPWIFYIILFIGSVILALGPNSFIPIYKICYKFIPFFSYPRSPARWIVFSILAVSILSSKGIDIILKRLKGNTKYIFGTIIACAILLDFHVSQSVGISRMKTYDNPYIYIKHRGQNSPILEIPIWPGDSSWSTIYEYYITKHRIPVINGYSSFVTKDYIDQIFWPLSSINMGMLNNEQYKLIKTLGVKFILLHEEAYPQKVSPFPFKLALENLKKSPYLKFILADGPIYLFQVMDKPPTFSPSAYTIPSKTGVFYECEYLPHRLGKVFEDPLASGNQSLYAKGPVLKPVHLVFGPWQLFPPGNYKIIYRIKIAGEKTPNKIATLEVTTNKGKTQIAHINLTAKDIQRDYKDYILHFTIDKLTELEFRIIYYGNGNVWADYVYLLCEEETDPVWYYKASDLFHIGREINNAVYATPLLDPPGNLIFGPYRRYPKGKYRVRFTLKADKISSQKSAVLKVTSGYNTALFAKQILQDIPTEYKNYWMEITLANPTILEFQVEFLKKVSIYVDSIKIEPVS